MTSYTATYVHLSQSDKKVSFDALLHSCSLISDQLSDQVDSKLQQAKSHSIPTRRKLVKMEITRGKSEEDSLNSLLDIVIKRLQDAIDFVRYFVFSQDSK